MSQGILLLILLVGIQAGCEELPDYDDPRDIVEGTCGGQVDQCEDWPAFGCGPYCEQGAGCTGPGECNLSPSRTDCQQFANCSWDGGCTGGYISDTVCFIPKAEFACEVVRGCVWTPR
ncbi:MAG: hypothetical protein JKY56_13880 [Kofleriaceae bacterium]|nr:hypothetical protein [Kofleriaceae bacterium]